MKAGTKYWMGVRHVGDGSWPDEVQEISVADMCRLFVRVMGEITLAQRVDVAIARTEDEVRQRLNGRMNSSGTKSQVNKDMNLRGELEAMMESLGMEEL